MMDNISNRIEIKLNLMIVFLRKGKMLVELKVKLPYETSFKFCIKQRRGKFKMFKGIVVAPAIQIKDGV